MASNNQSSVPEASKLQEVADRQKWAIKPKDLTMIWSEERNCWRIHEKDGTAELLQVCWLEVRGSVEKVTKGSTYEIRFKLSKTNKAFGWENAPVFIMAKIGDDLEDQLSKEIDLSKLGTEPDETTATFKIQFDSDPKIEDHNSDKETKSDPKTDPNSGKETNDPSCDKEIKSDHKTAAPNRDKKTKVSNGDKKHKDPICDKKTKSDTLYFGLYEVWTDNLKGGLIIHEAIVEEVTPDHASAPTSIR